MKNAINQKNQKKLNFTTKYSKNNGNSIIKDLNNNNNNNKVNKINENSKSINKNSHIKKKKTNIISNKKSNSINNNKKYILIIIIVGVITLLCIAGAMIYSYLNKSFDDNEEDMIKAKETLTETDNSKPFYMVLVGTDTRENQEDNVEKTYQFSNGRSDTCLLARIDSANAKITFVSIPRDTQISLNGNIEKFNAAYNYGGIASTIEQVKKLCKVEVSHYAEISFNGLTDMVNAVGGVEVDVPSAINDPKSGVSVPQGKCVLNGEQALSFARSRNFPDGDFTRSANQRVLLKALVDKGFQISYKDLPNIIKASKNFIRTDLSISEMLGLAKKAKEAEKITIYSAMIPSTTGTSYGASYCYTDKEALSRMIKLVDLGEDPLMVEIVNESAICSSRDMDDVKKRQQDYYREHPDSPGKAPTYQNSKTNNNQNYINEYSDKTNTYSDY